MRFVAGDILTFHNPKRHHVIVSIWNIFAEHGFHSKLCELNERDVVIFVHQTRSNVIVLTKSGLGFIDSLNLSYVGVHV